MSTQAHTEQPGGSSLEEQKEEQKVDELGRGAASEERGVRATASGVELGKGHEVCKTYERVATTAAAGFVLLSTARWSGERERWRGAYCV